MRNHRKIITALIAGLFAGSAYAMGPMQVALGPVNEHHEVGKLEEVTPAPSSEGDVKLGTTEPGEIAETGTEPAPSTEGTVCLGDTEPHEAVASIQRQC